MNKESFWIFGHLGLGDHIVCNALYRHLANIHKDKIVIIPIWVHNLSAVQWMLSDVPNIFFYPIETEQQLLNCQDGIYSGTGESWKDRQDYKNKMLCLGFYSYDKNGKDAFNPVKWDSEFYRQAELDPELKWKGFKLPDTGFDKSGDHWNVVHQDKERGFYIREDLIPKERIFLSKESSLAVSAINMMMAKEIHCIDSSMLSLADLMETPYCKRFVFHRYARKGLPPQLRKSWEILD